MGKKTAAQLKRLIKRAEARGEIYVPHSDINDEGICTVIHTEEGARSLPSTVDVVSSKQEDILLPPPSNVETSMDTIKLKSFQKYQNDIHAIEANTELKAKERRSAKRRAEAIAVETCGSNTTIDELLKWYETVGKQHEQELKKLQPIGLNAEKEKSDVSSIAVTQKKVNPYILFIGQLSFDTTKEELFSHIQKQLEGEHKVTDENIQIRMLNDIKTKKSRGMAFVEIKCDNPEFMYSCLKLHQTHLKGRRINVERSAGGGVQTRAAKIKQHRTEQEQYIDVTVNSMLEEYYNRGEIQRSGEIDDGVIKLCKRHSTTVVQAALERYVESNGRDMDNPSAYLSFLLTKLAEEGIFNNRDKKDNEIDSSKTKMKNKNSANAQKRPATHSKKENTTERKRVKVATNSAYQNSEFAKQGVDMSISVEKPDLQKIFPSLGRGRGRGRGYM
jgi:RNA recognition motif-containing protein